MFSLATARAICSRRAGGEGAGGDGLAEGEVGLECGGGVGEGGHEVGDHAERGLDGGEERLGGFGCCFDGEGIEAGHVGLLWLDFARGVRCGPW